MLLLPSQNHKQLWCCEDIYSDSSDDDIPLRQQSSRNINKHDEPTVA